MDLFDKIIEINTIHLGPDDILVIKVPDDIDKKVRLIQAKWIRNNHGSCSYSKAMNNVIREYF